MADTRRRTRATVRRKNQLTLPPGIAEALHVHEGDEVEFSVTDEGTVVLRGLTVIPADQRWFWSEEWQHGEREANRELIEGEGNTFLNPEDMFADLVDDSGDEH